MKIKNLKIFSFGKLSDKEIYLEDNLNVIYGPNESGKSTISAFIEAMLYSFPPRDANRKRYIPWDKTTASGAMTIEENGNDVTIYRKFTSSPKSDELTVTPHLSLDTLLPFNRETYRKSVYSSEGNLSDFGTTEEIDIKISNIAAAGDETTNPLLALDLLEKARRTLKARRGNGGTLNELENKISSLENELFKAQSVLQSQNGIKEDLQLAQNRLSSLTEHRNQLKASLSESGNSPLKALNEEIERQKEYIASFPSLDSSLHNPTDKPIELLMSIICTLVLFIMSFILIDKLIFISPIPLVIWFAVFIFKKIKCKSTYKKVLSKAGCSTLDEYNVLIKEKTDAENHYKSLLSQKTAYLEQSADLKNPLSERLDSINEEIFLVRNKISLLKDMLKKDPLRPLDEIQSDLSYYKALYEEQKSKLLAIDSAIEAVEHARCSVSKDFSPLINKHAMEYINLVAPEKFRNFELSKDFTLTVTDPVPRDISSYSHGLKQEIYLCYRLALSDILFGNSFPLILDNPFTGSDDYREKALIDVLYSISKTRQVIIFTNRHNIYFNQLHCNWVDITPHFDV